MNKVDRAEKITKLARWIDGAEEELKDIGKGKILLEIHQPHNGMFRSHYIGRMSDESNTKLDKYIKRLARAEIKQKKQQLAAL